MRCRGEPILVVEHAERHLSDGQRRSEIGLRNINLRAGSTYSLCGPNGIGKTTALEILSLAGKPSSFGKMTLYPDPTPIDLAALLADDADADIAEVRARHFGYVVQTSRLFPYLTVRENILLSQTIINGSDIEYAEHLMQRLEIDDLADTRPSKLSGGQRQRVCVARSLSHRPAVLLADEPTSSIDAEMGRRILTTILEFTRDYNATAVIITHDGELVKRFSLTELPVTSRSANRVLKTTVFGEQPEAATAEHFDRDEFR